MRLILLLVLLSVSCSNQNGITGSGTQDPPKGFGDLTDSEKREVYSQISETFKGDYRKYVGQNQDSSEIKLLLDRDQRFAIGFQPFSENKMEIGDSIITFQFSNSIKPMNVCVGRWSDEGQMIKLRFLLGQTSFFDSLRNEGVVELIDDKTVLLSKAARKIWISGALCEGVN